MSVLLERESQFALLDRQVADLTAGHGSFLVLEGEPGLGKTVLLDELHHRAESSGIAVLRAAGSPVEATNAYGVVRQLFEPTLTAMSDAERSNVLRGAAALAQHVVGGAPLDLIPDPYPVEHALWWLCAQLAEQRSLLFIVDDLQWCDEPSLGFLRFCAHRARDVPTGFALASWPVEAGSTSSAITGSAGVARSRLERLGDGAVADLVQQELGQPDREFVAAVVAATGGVPFLVTALIGTLAERRVTPAAAAAVDVADFAPEHIVHALHERLAGLGEVATRMAHALAVLGRPSALARVGAVAGVEPGEAAKARHDLVDAHLLAAGSVCDFVHALVRTAIYDGMDERSRSGGHRRAAAVLADQGARAESVAAHLHRTDPMGSDWVVAQLQAAAQDARVASAPGIAVMHLRRAREEGVGRELQAAVVAELAVLEKELALPTAVESLQEARRLCGDPVADRVLAAHLAETLVYGGDWDAGVELLEEVLEDDLTSADVHLHVRTLWATASSYHLRGVKRLDVVEPVLVAEAAADSPGARSLSVLLASRAANQGKPSDVVSPLLTHGLHGSTRLAEIGAESTLLTEAASAYIGIDDLESVERLADEVDALGRSRGSTLGVVHAGTLRTTFHDRSGALLDAEAAMRTAYELASERGLTFQLIGVAWAAANALAERPTMADVAQVVAEFAIPDPFSETVMAAGILELRGRIDLGLGRRTAEKDLRGAGEIFDGLGYRNPLLTRWREMLVRALGPGAEAREIAAELLAIAEASDIPRAVGVALMAAGNAADRDGGLDLLADAVRLLDRSGSQFDRATAQVDLGSALRRAGHRAEARSVITEGLAGAQACGADRLADRAREELLVAGGRPRRVEMHGQGALTPSELRVARMAADGRSNSDIAQTLFVTVNTVESHLRNAYRKLGIKSRVDLVDRLA